MADGTKRVFSVNGPAHPVFTEIIGKRGDIRFDLLKNDSPDDVATPILAGAHAYQSGSARDELAKKYHAGPDLLRRTQSLLIVSTNGAGYDTVNLKACTEAGVLALNQAGGNKEAVAEHALAMMLSLTKRIVESDRASRREIIDRNVFTGHDLFGQTVGIIGLGNVGKRLAQLCNGLFSMRALAYDPYVSAEVMKQNNVEKVDLDTLMRESDFVSINCPLTDESRGLVGEKQYALMKPNAYFVTTARGNIHDEKALEAVLRA
jgi:D-3-phosphoglycerate dehydrogenase